MVIALYLTQLPETPYETGLLFFLVACVLSLVLYRLAVIPVTTLTQRPLHNKKAPSKRRGISHNLEPSHARVKQPYDAFLVLDVEATCVQGGGLNWPNEIIVCHVEHVQGR
jgi:hypothetical protein